MGSFNETCALSNLDIPYGTKVRLLFLTQNPYVNSDGHEAHRGCYHYDNWFVRTPPLKGVYADYGRAELEDSPLQQLIADVFSKDIVERPYGSNQYHDHPVLPGKDLSHYIQAAWDGRLLVQDEYTRPRNPVPENWPTWKRVFALFREANLPIQHEVGGDDGAGYNAQPIIPGVVAVNFNSYNDTTRRLKTAMEVLSPHYDCRVIKKINDAHEKCLMVTVKGGFDNPTLLAEINKITEALTTHPAIAQMYRYRQLPVLAVMIRDDVWQTFCRIGLLPTWRDSEKPSVKSLREKLEKFCIEVRENRATITRASERAGIAPPPPNLSSDFRFRDVLLDIPFQVTASTHLTYAIEQGRENKELVQACAELARVEIVLSRLNRPWFIPPLGGQESEWELHGRLLQRLHDIAKKQLAKEKEEY